MERIEQRIAFDRVRYANCWEDADILCRALEPAPGKRILSIASAGDNSLALLAEGAEVVAVDLNPAQLACLELRREAIRCLSYDACLAFLGVRPSLEREEMYLTLRSWLSHQARDFWDSHPLHIKQGIIHVGKFEQYFAVFRKRVLPLIHSQRNVQLLLQPKMRDARVKFYQEVWANRRWHLLFRLFFSRMVMGRLGRDPEMFRYADEPVAASIMKRTAYALTELETHTNPYLEYILRGNFVHSLPRYLRRSVFEAIRANIDRLHIIQGSIQEVARANTGTGFDGYNLSDVFEYLDEETCEEIFGQLIAAANPGARLAYWNMQVTRNSPAGMRRRIHQCKDLSEKLFREDKAFFYRRFIIEEVQ